MANIVIGKCGKSVCFNPDKWGAIGGDNEAPTLFLALARLNPQNTYYMISRSNLSKMPEDFRKRYPNIVDVWEGGGRIKDLDYVCRYPYEWITKNNIHIDTGIFYSGPTSGTSIPHLRKHPDGSFYTPLQCFNFYCAPIHDFCNRSGIKYLHLLVDPRYFPYKSADLYNRPAKILSQYEGTSSYKHIVSYDDLTEIPCVENITYDEIEKVFFIGKEKLDFSKLQKTTKMLIVLNEGKNGVLSRGPELEKYVLRNFSDVEVYGQWSENWTSKYPRNFKGSKKFSELESLLKSVKYTFIIPISQGWVTSKIWEMLHYGIVPFLHPWYDGQHHLPLPKFLRVETPEDLYKRIDYLEKNPDKYEKLLNHLHSLLLDSYYDGTHINGIINGALREIGIENV